MEQISLEKKFDLYMDSLEKFGALLLTMSDEMIDYYVFEEADICVASFMSKENMQELLDEGIIDDNIYEKSLLLNEEFIGFRETELWNVNSVKKDNRWHQLLCLSDEILKLIYERWEAEDMKILRDIRVN